MKNQNPTTTAKHYLVHIRFHKPEGIVYTDLHEDLAAEQKARATYEYLIRLGDDPDVLEPLKFLREREVVHFQRFGEALRIVQDYLQEPHLYVMPKPDFMKK